ncbi:DUF4839 domain-containing protein [Clostridium sp.]|uniref:DUF4839 domain-containing protein n=1 Tax=Clostridium sp. TaxID=1506 RepID=UPI003520DC67
MKRLLTVFMSFMMILGLTACGGSKTEAEKPEGEKYTVKIEIACTENLFFSKYDVDIFLDNEVIGTLEHGATDIYTIEIEEGEHTLKVEKEDDSSVDGTVKFTVSEDMELRYKISLSSSQIEIEENVEEEDITEEESSKEEKKVNQERESEESEVTEEVAANGEEESETEEILTVDNCEELAAILSLKDEFDNSIKVFAEKYDGRTIEFDGNVAYVSPHENYNTRFDYLIYGGDYNENSISGPSFQFENVNYSDLHLKGDNVPDTFGIGINIHIVAKIEEYDEKSGLFKLTPVAITMR